MGRWRILLASVPALTTPLFVVTGPAAGAQTVSELQNGIVAVSDDAFSEDELGDDFLAFDDDFGVEVDDDFAGDTDND